ncbi:tol-pal system protein YbgF [uncultured Maricaulis sp.]|uniref:tol-pal system protein YbgF n=1 Tax=uncultured Maricaulis sp. TaxID=174710 RepID=UPI002615DBF6|nr:tol-pal system protein YbgF [uncultured Maricaulis sp.]
MIRYIFCSTLFVALLAATPADAQSRRELAERIDATEVRIGELEAEFMAGDPVAEALIRRMDELEYQVQALTGESERLSFENRQLRQQVEVLERELEANRRPSVPAADDPAVAWMNEGLGPDGETVLEDGAETANGAELAIIDPDDPHGEARAAATGVLGGAPVIGEGGDAARVDPAATYEAARARLLDGDFVGAQDGFERFVADNPDHGLTSQAYYWLGETFYVRSDFTQAADAYIASLRQQPEGEKAPDALVRLAASLHGMGRTEDACATLARFGRQFPNAAPASQARAARESVRANCR